jgi:hypothetical protein
LERSPDLIDEGPWPQSEQFGHEHPLAVTCTLGREVSGDKPGLGPAILMRAPHSMLYMGSLPSLWEWERALSVNWKETDVHELSLSIRSCLGSTSSADPEPDQLPLSPRPHQEGMWAGLGAQLRPCQAHPVTDPLPRASRYTWGSVGTGLAGLPHCVQAQEAARPGGGWGMESSPSRKWMAAAFPFIKHHSLLPLSLGGQVHGCHRSVLSREFSLLQECTHGGVGGACGSVA